MKTKNSLDELRQLEGYREPSLGERLARRIKHEQRCPYDIRRWRDFTPLEWIRWGEMLVAEKPDDLSGFEQLAILKYGVYRNGEHDFAEVVTEFERVLGEIDRV